MSMFSKVTKSLTSPSSLAGAAVGFATGGLPGAVIGYGAGSFMDYNQTEQARQQNKLNQQAVDRANAYDLQMWNLANQYNDPKQQMARLAAAGLNPNLVYGGGNVSGNTAGVAGSNGAASTVAANRVGNAMQLAQMGANLASTKQDIARSKAQEAYTEAQTKNLNNFLNGTGKSTFTRPDQSVPVVGETPDGSVDQDLQDLVDMFPKNARPFMQKRVVGPLYNLGKRMGESVAAHQYYNLWSLNPLTRLYGMYRMFRDQ